MPRDILSACPTDLVPIDRFPDNTSGAHRQSINCIAFWQVTLGRNVGSINVYGPAEDVTRGQLASFLVRLLRASGATVPAVTTDRFRDDNGDTHEASINSLAAINVVEGFDNGTSRPSAGLTRAQMASLIARAYQYRAGEVLPAGPNFFDDDAGVHETNISVAAAKGLVAGTGGRTFAPAATLRRDQMASFLVRLLDLLVDEEGVIPPGIAL